MQACGTCGSAVEGRFRFCPWCAAPLRLKLVEFFRPHPLIDADHGKALRVSRYLGDPGARHVRFSVWSESGETAEALAAVSLDEAETRRLRGFLAYGAEHAPPPATVRRLLEQLRR